MDRIVLVGFMGAGKTATGRALARHLGWDFLDVDEVVEARAGRSIPEIFRSSGENAFRELEEEIAAEALEARESVVATGGGWAAVEGRLASLPEGTLSVWLRVTPETAVERAALDGDTRPLLAGSDPLRAATELLDRRTPGYAAADVRVDTEGRSVDDVTRRILEILEEIESENRR
ncbi:MAG: shikimate kinase [Longimicrobiales bacterium]|nr:shikimate kinase [Longimicrobiales bacterium]